MMPVRDIVRLDLKQAKDNGDNTITSRAYPLTFFPRYAEQMVAFMIDQITIAPNNAPVEIHLIRNSQEERVYSTIAGGLLPVGELIQYETATLLFYNFNVNAGASIIMAITSYRYNEPMWTQ